MAWGGVFGLVACFMVSFALVGAAFFAWWTIRAELKGIPDVKAMLVPFEDRYRALEKEISRLGEVPAALRKRIDEAEERAAAAEKKVTSFTAQLGAMKRWLNRESLPANGEEDAEAPPNLWAAPAAEPSQNPVPAGFGKTMRKVG